MIKKPKITKEQKELDNKFKELNGNIVYQLLVSDKGFDKSSSELEEVVKESRGNGFLYKTKDEEVFMYVEGRLDELDKNKVYFYTENDILVITSMSEESLMKKVKSIHSFFGELIQEKIEVNEKSEEETMSKTIKETKTYYIVKLVGQGKNRYLCMIGHSDHPEWQPCQSSFPKESATRFDSIEKIPKVKYREYDVIKVTEEVIIEKNEETLEKVRGWRD